MNNACAAKNDYPHPRNVVNFLAYLECSVYFLAAQPVTSPRVHAPGRARSFPYVRQPPVHGKPAIRTARSPSIKHRRAKNICCHNYPGLLT